MNGGNVRPFFPCRRKIVIIGISFESSRSVRETKIKNPTTETQWQQRSQKVTKKYIQLATN